jgi:hypothetical protein
MSKTVAPLLWTFLTTGLLAGCSSGKLAPVQGKVSYPDGKPYAGGQVIFDPVDPANNTTPQGDIQEDGTFALGTNKARDGAAPGQYKVRVVPPAPKRAARKIVFPPSPRIAPAEFTVTTDGSNDVDLVVQTPAR